MKMKVLISTNILLSASLSDQGAPYQAYQKAVTFPYRGVVSNQNIDELRRVYNREFPAYIHALERFLVMALNDLEIVDTPTERISDEDKIRDSKARFILRAAVKAKVDIIITGNKDFLEAGVTNPKIMTADEFIKVEKKHCRPSDGWVDFSSLRALSKERQTHIC